MSGNLSREARKALEELFAEASAAEAIRRKVVGDRRVEKVKPLPLEDTQFFLRPAPRTEARPLPLRTYPPLPNTIPISFPAPHREAVDDANGWTDQPWSLAGVIRLRKAGGFFKRGNHQFASRRAAELALAADFDVELALDELERGERVPPSPDSILEVFWAECSAALPSMR